jgi:hypothetical protein
MLMTSFALRVDDAVLFGKCHHSAIGAPKPEP